MNDDESLLFGVVCSENICSEKIVKRALKNKLKLLLENPRHPSLRVKKIKGQNNIFAAIITIKIRITWQYYNDSILLRNFGEHDKTPGKP